MVWQDFSGDISQGERKLHHSATGQMSVNEASTWHTHNQIHIKLYIITVYVRDKCWHMLCLCMFSEPSVGSNGSFGLSRPEETQTGWSLTPSQPTYIRKKRGREKRHRLTLREIQRKRKLKTDVKSWMRLMSGAELSWDIKHHDVSRKGNSPWQRERDLFVFRWHRCASVKPRTHKKIYF